MRTAAFTLLLFVAFGNAANSQRFSLLPQVGSENSKTSISYNNLSYFSPEGFRFSPQASLRLVYTSRHGHGFFAGASTSRSMVLYNFTNPETGMTNFISSLGNMQVRMEGGYQFSTRPIYFNKSGKTQNSTAAKTSTNTYKKQCGSYYRSGCSKNSSSASKCGNKSTAKSKSTAKQGSWFKIQPSIGMAYIPTGDENIGIKNQSGQTSYEFKAGNWNTAFITGASFEFGKANNALFTVSLNYLKGIGNMGPESFETLDGTKVTTTTLESRSSSWNLRVGIPFSLGKKANAVTKNQPAQKKSCIQNRVIYRCRTTL